MKASLYTHFLLSSLVLLFSTCGTAAAQNVVFSANASAAKIGMADQLQVTYMIQDVEGLQALNPVFKDFKLLAGPFQSQSSSTQVSGNRMVQSTSMSFTFILQPKHTGTIVLPPATARDAAGHNYQSNGLQVEVVAGSLAARQQRAAPNSPWGADPFGAPDPFAPPSRQQGSSARQSAPQPVAAAPRVDPKDIFIKVDVDKKSVHIGEQVTALYKLYARIPMQVAISKLPSLNGFWTQDFDIPKQPKPVEEIVNGKKYQVFVLKKSALFPQQPGTLVLDAAEAEGNAHVVTQTQRSNPFDDPFFKQAFGGSLMMSDPFFNDPFADLSYTDVPVHLKSVPVNISVSDLPAAGRPEDFTGAVGSYTLAAKMDRKELTTDDVATLTLTIKGSGNLHLFTAPKLSLPNGLDSYEPTVMDTITGRTTTISGDKIITYTIAPRKSGEYAIPPLSLAWYDVHSGSYKSLATGPLRLHVKPGKGIAAASVAAAEKGGDINDALTLSAARPLILSAGYWAMYAIPLLSLVFISFYRKREDEQQNDLAQLRKSKASTVAQKRLAAAGAMLQKGQARGFYEEVSKSIWLYLSDKLGIPISALGRTTASEAMTHRGVPTPVQQQIEQVLNECELALYAPMGGSQQMQQTFSEAASIITGLERTLRTS